MRSSTFQRRETYRATVRAETACCVPTTIADSCSQVCCFPEEREKQAAKRAREVGQQLHEFILLRLSERNIEGGMGSSHTKPAEVCRGRASTRGCLQLIGWFLSIFWMLRLNSIDLNASVLIGTVSATRLLVELLCTGSWQAQSIPPSYYDRVRKEPCAKSEA